MVASHDRDQLHSLHRRGSGGRTTVAPATVYLFYGDDKENLRHGSWDRIQSSKILQWSRNLNGCVCRSWLRTEVQKRAKLSPGWPR